MVLVPQINLTHPILNDMLSVLSIMSLVEHVLQNVMFFLHQLIVVLVLRVSKRRLTVSEQDFLKIKIKFVLSYISWLNQYFVFFCFLTYPILNTISFISFLSQLYRTNAPIIHSNTRQNEHVVIIVICLCMKIRVYVQICICCW